MTTSTSTLVLVVVPKTNDILFRPSLKSSFSFISHTSFSPLLHSLSLPQALSTQRPPSYFHSRIFSLSPQPQPQGNSSAPTQVATKKPVAVYLRERLGFSEEDSLAVSKKLLRLREDPRAKQQVNDLISYQTTDNVITFLQQHCGLSHSQIQKLIFRHPRLLTAHVDKTIKPKVKLLEDLGFSTSDLAHVLSANPRLYLVCDLSPAIQALRGFLGNDEDVVTVFKGLSWGPYPTVTKTVIPNVTMLENEYGIPRDKLIKFLTKSPKSLLRNTESLRDVLVRMEEKWGISRDSAQFVKAIGIFCGFSDENIDSKCQVFRSYRWSDSDILSLIRRNPSSLRMSEATIKKKLEFFVNELGYEPAYLASRPVLLSCSLENRVVPRHRVLSLLKEKGLIKADYQLYSGYKLTDNQFFDRFIRPFKNEVPELCEIYINGAGGAPTEQLKHLETSENKPSTLVALE